jgi:hypothetical protein
MTALRPFGLTPTVDRFAALSQALRGSGGIAWGDDLTRLLDDYRLGETLAQLIAHRDVFGFEFRASFWVPMFQFDLSDLSLTRGAAPVVAKLAEAFDGWALAGWFAWPNPCLGGWRPVDMLDATPANVLTAARVARAIHH